MTIADFFSSLPISGLLFITGRGDGTRVFTARTARLEMSLLLVEQGDDTVVLDLRIPTSQQAMLAGRLS